MADFIRTINGYLWGFPMIAFLFCTHLYMSCKTGFIQRKVLKGVRLSLVSSDKKSGGMSPFSCLATSLASTLGTGNIIGVSTAVSAGGAGAVFWCWITGVLGMATQYAECLLSVKYRKKNGKGEYCGGPMYVLEQAVKSKRLAVIYAVMASVCGLVTGAAIQSNSIAEVVRQSVLGTSGEFRDALAPVVGLVTAILTALVIFGGIKSIGRVCGFLVPIMAFAYLTGCTAVLFINREVLVLTFRVILKEAFSLKAVGGGVSGGAMMLACRYGIARGLFSNEAGLGTSSIVSACAETKSPVKQGIIAMTATFWDTVVMCLVTGVVVVSTLLKNPRLILSEGGVLCYEAFGLIPYVGEVLLLLCMITFAFSTVLGWSVVGEKCAEYAFSTGAVVWYRLAWVLCVLLSPLISLGAVWDLGDLINALLVIPNVTALILLSKEVNTDTKEYFG